MSSTALQSDTSATTGWKVQASCGALNTSNPIREIIETMNLAENPNKKVIPLSIGDPTIFGNLKPCREILDALNKANMSGKYYGYQTASGMEAAREAVAEYHVRSTGNRVKRQVSMILEGSLLRNQLERQSSPIHDTIRYLTTTTTPKIRM